MTKLGYSVCGLFLQLMYPTRSNTDRPTRDESYPRHASSNLKTRAFKLRQQNLSYATSCIEAIFERLPVPHFPGIYLGEVATPTRIELVSHP